MMHGRKKSDSVIVAGKPTNKAATVADEPAEPRTAAKGNASRQSTYRTQSRKTRVTNAILDTVEARFVALEMQLKAAESRAKSQFQFACERQDAGGIVELPNPLKPRRLEMEKTAISIAASPIGARPMARAPPGASGQFRGKSCLLSFGVNLSLSGRSATLRSSCQSPSRGVASLPSSATAQAGTWPHRARMP